MKGNGGQGRHSGDMRLGDVLVGLPCLQRQRAELSGEHCLKRSVVRCSVCGMEGEELLFELAERYKPVILRVQERFPGWQPEDGLCLPCLERFRLEEKFG